MNLRYLGIYMYLLLFIVLGVNIVDEIFDWDMTKKRMYMVVSLVSFFGFAIVVPSGAVEYTNLLKFSLCLNKLRSFSL